MLPIAQVKQRQVDVFGFNGHPPLGVNATNEYNNIQNALNRGFNGHPPLGVNATAVERAACLRRRMRFNGHPPLGVNATV